MITEESAARLRQQLMSVLAEDAHNTERLLSRLDALSRETGIEAHAALLLLLTHLPLEEEEARRNWEAVLAHREQLSRSLRRDVGIRVALLDYFSNVNRRMVQPTLIDLEMYEAGQHGEQVDPLTGLAVERAFRSSVDNELRRAKRYGHELSLAVFDLDGFSKINDRAGVLVGDRILREVAMILKNKIRDIDIAARPGEDEMALVLPTTDRNGAVLVAERFRLEIEAHFAKREAGGAPADLTVSGGVACYPEDATSVEVLLERAAQAMYRAKSAGKNAIAVYHPERRRYLRFDLAPERFEVEVLRPREMGAGPLRNLSGNGIIFGCPEPLHVGEEIEIRVIDPDEPGELRARGRVVRLEEFADPDTTRDPLEASGAGERFEVAVVIDDKAPGSESSFVQLLGKARSRQGVS